MRRHSAQYNETPDNAWACAVAFSSFYTLAIELAPWHSAKAYETGASRLAEVPKAQRPQRGARIMGPLERKHEQKSI